MDWRLFGYIILAFSIVFFLLWLINYPRHKRYKQRICPVAALLISGAAVVVYIHPYAFIQGIEALAVDWLNRQLGLSLSTSLDRIPVLLNIAVLLTAFVLKILQRPVNFILNCFIRLYRWGIGIFTKCRPMTSPQGEMSPAYEKVMDRGILLRRDWIYSAGYFQILAWTTVFLAIAAIFWDFFSVPSGPIWILPALPAIPALFFFEVAWYLGGICPGEVKSQFEGADAVSNIEGRFERLWNDYHSKWPDRLLSASPNVELFHNRAMAIPSDKRRKGDGNDTDLIVAEQNLGRQNIELTATQKSILRDLWENKDVVVIESLYEQVAPVLFSRLQRHLLDGGHLLFLVPEHIRFRKTDVITAWLRHWLDFPCFYQSPYDIRWGENNNNNICISCVSELHRELLNNNPAWFQHLRAVVVLDSTSSLFHDISATLALSLCLASLTGKNLQYIFLSTEDRSNLESVLREFSGVEPEEYRLYPASNQYRRYLAWKYEGDKPFQEGILESGRYIGCEPVLAVPAIEDRVNDILFSGMEKVQWWEGMEEIDKSIPSSLTRGIVKNLEVPSVTTPVDMPVVVCHDTLSNLPISIKQGFCLGRKDVLVLASAPPYLLRDYFVGNMNFFLSTEANLRTRLAPSPIGDKYTWAYCLLALLQHGPVRGDFLYEKMMSIHYPGNLEQRLDRLFKEVFGFNLLRDGWLARNVCFEFDAVKKIFTEVEWFSFVGTPPGEVEYCELVDPSNNILMCLPMEHLYQNFLPGQTHVFGGEPYLVPQEQLGGAKIQLQHAPIYFQGAYVPKLFIDGFGGRVLSKQMDRFGSVQITKELWETNFKVRTKGYHTLGYHAQDEIASWRLLEEGVVPERVYNTGRTLRIVISGDDVGVKRKEMAVLLAILFQGISRTVFPENWQFLLITSPGESADDIGNMASPADLLPTFRDSLKEDKHNVVLCLFEDSLRDMGLVKAIHDNLILLFDLIFDYVTWLLNSNESAEIRPIHGVPFCVARETYQACSDVLNSLIAHFDYPLHRQRERFLEEGEGAMASESGRTCDFCGEAISDSSFERLSDGRERCAYCRDSAVNTLDELQNIYHWARKWMLRRFSPITIRKGIKVVFATAEEIARERGMKFVPTAGFDPRAVGVAIWVDDDYSIFIENGQPYHMTLGTLVHEMTHIWQYDNLDMEKMENEHGKLYIEGHATWVEVKCLKERGIGIGYTEREMKREDVYGQGARAMVTLIGNDDAQTPFSILKQKYPK